MQFECVAWEILSVAHLRLGKFAVFESLGNSFVVVCVTFE